MSEQRELLKIITDKLTANGIKYMTSGSVASSYYGEPRATNDVDIIIEGYQQNISEFADTLGQRFYVSKTAVLAALQNQGMFNVIDTETGLKVDIMIRKGRQFSIEEFGRRRPAELMGINTWVTSPEDLILSKLEWCKGRELESQQARDVAGIIRVQRERLDLKYLRKWGKELGVDEVLEVLLKQAGIKSE